jgi:sugar (pentulose or hexulose) kinase
MLENAQTRLMAPVPIAALGIDVGTSNTKVVLVNVAGDGFPILAAASAPTPESPVGILALVGQLTKTVSATSPVAPVAIGIASMAETGVVLDRDGAAMTSLIRWNTVQGASGTSRIIEELGAARFGELTGLPALPKVPLLVWERLGKTAAGWWNAGARWSGAADLIALALTGELVTDHTLAARTGAVAGPQGFDSELLGRVGMSIENLPRIAEPGEVAGVTAASSVARFALRSGIPVYVAGHDHAVGAWAAGVRNPGEVADSLGTAEAIVRVIDGPVDRVGVTATGMTVAATVDGNRSCIVAGAAGVGGLVNSLREVLALDDPSDAAASPPGIPVLPYPSGRQTPNPDPTPRFTGLDESATPRDRTRSLFEGLALHARWMHEEQRLRSNTADSGPIRVLGGPGAQNALWLAIKGAVFPVASVRVLSREPVAVGAAALAAERAGIRVGSVLASEPLPPPDARYDPVFRDFVASARRQQ